MSLLSLLIFLIPTNLFLKLDEQLGYAAGLRIDYLIPKLYLSNLAALAFVLVFFFTKQRSLPKTRVFVFFALVWSALFLRQFFTAVPTSSLWFFGELTLAGLVSWTLTRLPKKVLETPALYWSLAATLLLQSLVALGQFVWQKSLFGYWFLGESDLLHFAGIATQSIAGQEFIVPSGTSAHPNVLAGFLVIGTILLWQKRGVIPKWLFFLASAASIFSLFLTFSVSSWLALALALCFFMVRSKLAVFEKKMLLLAIWSLLIFIPLALTQATYLSSDTSLTRRVALSEEALRQFVAQPIWGQGANSFVRNLAENNNAHALERFVQPAHHVPLLLLAETGLLGGALFFVLFLLVRQKKFSIDKLLLVSCLFVPLLSLDHYLYTLETGRLIVAVLLVMVLQNWKHSH